MATRYTYAARTLAGLRVEGVRSAEGEGALAADLARESLFLTRAYIAREAAVQRFSSPKIKRKDRKSVV